MRFNSVLAFGIIALTFIGFGVIIHERLGGNEALFLILGHTTAWVEMVVIYHFRKRPPTNGGAK